MNVRRPFPLLLSIILGFLTVLGVAMASAFVLRNVAAPAQDSRIPHERALIAAGLSGVPAPGQPSRPLAVERVVVDTAHTYIIYHYTVDPGSGYLHLPLLSLFDDTGAFRGAAGDVRCDRTQAGWPLQNWLPWHPSPMIRCLDIEDAALPPTVHAVVLNLDAQLSPPILPGFPAPPHVESVRVPLDLRGLVRVPAR